MRTRLKILRYIFAYFIAVLHKYQISQSLAKIGTYLHSQ